ncbi:MAG: DinB family protein [Bacteroidetes bacterium]|nr:DinB family protein [Bacteroidota bacterium]
MEQTKLIANRFREVILNGVWIANTNYKDQLSNLTWKQATSKIVTLNTIAALTFHINYYIAGILNVFEGGLLEIRDKYSFDAPPIHSQKDWEELLNTLWNNADKLASMVEQIPDKKLDEVFIDIKYGNYQRNIEALIEHSYYHLGQITLIKKLIIKTEK